MPVKIDNNSVGLVTPEKFHCSEPISLSCGEVLPEFDIVYECYGTLNSSKSNALLICHALSGDHHVAGYHTWEDEKPGWWDRFIGPGKVFDTDRFFIVCCNNLGGCSGSTGPTTTNPINGNRYGPDFPLVTVSDWVESQARLADHLGIEAWLAVIGGSLGGMQAMQWSVDQPDRIKNAIVIAAAPKLTAQNIAFNEVARQAILTDPNFFEGRYYEHSVQPDRGLRLARMLGHITYLSDDSMAKKFGRDLRQGKINFDYSEEFEIERYLRYQGDQFVGRFDANSYLLITKVLDYYDPEETEKRSLAEVFSRAKCDFWWSLSLPTGVSLRHAPKKSLRHSTTTASMSLTVKSSQVRGMTHS
jgi:homoserine O-acetyltransferase